MTKGGLLVRWIGVVTVHRRSGGEVLLRRDGVAMRARSPTAVHLGKSSEPVLLSSLGSRLLVRWLPVNDKRQPPPRIVILLEIYTP